MRPLHHPSLEEITVEGVLYALSDPVRAHIYAQLAAADCTKTCSAFLKAQGRPLPKSTLCHHFRILREAGLIRSERRGVELHNKTRCAELKSKFGSLIQSILKAYRSQSPSRSNEGKFLR
jgi:DNA-binding transcriptional ArsR family regulator